MIVSAVRNPTARCMYTSQDLVSLLLRETGWNRSPEPTCSRVGKTPNEPLQQAWHSAFQSSPWYRLALNLGASVTVGAPAERPPLGGMEPEMSKRWDAISSISGAVAALAAAFSNGCSVYLQAYERPDAIFWLRIAGHWRR